MKTASSARKMESNVTKILIKKIWKRCVTLPLNSLQRGMTLPCWCSLSLMTLPSDRSPSPPFLPRKNAPSLSSISRFVFYRLRYRVLLLVICLVLYSRTYDCQLIQVSIFVLVFQFESTFPGDFFQFSTTFTFQLSFGTLHQDTYLYNKLCSR